MILSARIRRSGKRSDLIKKLATESTETLRKISENPKGSVAPLTQVGEHVGTVIIVPGAGTIERIQIGGRKGRGGDRQGNRLIESLQAG